MRWIELSTGQISTFFENFLKIFVCKIVCGFANKHSQIQFAVFNVIFFHIPLHEAEDQFNGVEEWTISRKKDCNNAQRSQVLNEIFVQVNSGAIQNPHRVQ